MLPYSHIVMVKKRVFSFNATVAVHTMLKNLTFYSHIVMVKKTPKKLMILVYAQDNLIGSC